MRNSTFLLFIMFLRSALMMLTEVPYEGGFTVECIRPFTSRCMTGLPSGAVDDLFKFDVLLGVLKPLLLPFGFLYHQL